MEIKQLLTNFVPKIKLMAYEKKIPVDMDCPLRLTMSLIESKWKSCILDELRNGTSMRPSEIHKCLPDLMLKWGTEHYDIFERKYGNTANDKI